MPKCPFKINDYVMTRFLGPGKVTAIVLGNKEWRIKILLAPNINSYWFSSDSLKLATKLEILLYV